MVLLIIIPIKWLFHWEYTQHFQTNPYLSHFAEVSLGVYIDGNWQFDSFHREIGCSLKDRVDLSRRADL